MDSPSSSSRVIRSDSSDARRMEICKQIFRRAVDAVRPANLVRNQISKAGTTLKIGNEYMTDLQEFSGVQIVGFGKAVLPMAEELIDVFEVDQLRKCVLSVPFGTRATDPRIELHRGAKNNIPDTDSFTAAVKITETVSSALPNDLTIILISGGGSALLPYPLPPVTLSEKRDLVRALSRAGADITELNIVRKKLSLVKGGGLLKFCHSEQVVALILSDVLGDDLETIASGPTVIPTSKSVKASDILRKFNIPISANVQSALDSSPVDDQSPSRKPIVTNLILGNNSLALSAASAAASEAAYTPIVLASMLQGEARTVGESIAGACAFVEKIIQGTVSESESDSFLSSLQISPEAQQRLGDGIVATTLDEQRLGVCLLFGGETTVTVTGSGIGGRNQELALAAALTLNRVNARSQVVICSGGTDGIDGPCDAAGAVVTARMVASAREIQDAENFLANNDSYTYFKSVKDGKFHLVTGHTETNVMDVVICLVPKLAKMSSSNL